MLRRKGTTLIETLIGIAILAFVMTFALAMFSLSTEKLARSKFRVLATALATEQVEIIRNLPYDQVGTAPETCNVVGTMPKTSTVVRSNVSFSVDTCVKWVDDPFDKLVSDTPTDTVPTDYKLVEVTVSWLGGDAPVKFTTTVTPKGLESPSNTGSLLITVYDASVLPVSFADVTVTNTVLVPAVNIVSKTDDQGKLQLLGLAPDAGNNYHIVVTKLGQTPGYTTDQTEAATVQLPNPVLQDFTLSAGGIVDVAFNIDRVSSLAFTTVGETCTAIPNVVFNLKGQKLKGNPPPDPVLKYDQNFTTNASGQATAGNLEWDQYTLTLDGTSHTIAGIIPPASLNVLPNTNPLVQLILSSYSANSLLASVKDANTGLPVSGATITVAGVGSKVTGQGAWAQTDWFGGSPADYTADDGNVDVTTTAGQVTLRKSTAADSVTESFSATTYKDSSTTAVWDTSAGEVRLPQTSGQYDASAVAQSLKLPVVAGKIVRATLSATGQANGQSIQYYLAADGVTFEAVTPGVAYDFVATGDDLRFKVQLATTDPAVTPVVTDLSIAVTIEAYTPNGNLTSLTFDTGSTSNFIDLTWNPQSQGGNVGADAVRFQLAMNDDNATWNYLGPDGTAATYFTNSGTSVPVALQDKRYVRYKMFLQTSDQKFTPAVTDVSLGYTSGCTPPGQAYFPALSVQMYSVTITKTGYVDLIVDVDVSGSVQNTFSLTPN